MRTVVEPMAKDEWRTVPPEAVEELLLLGGYAFELGEGLADAALRDLRHLLGTMPASGSDPSEVLNSIIAGGLQGRNAFWRSRYVETGRRLVTELWHSSDAGPPDLASLPPRSFRVEFSRTFDIGSDRAGSAVRLRLPLPVEDSHLTDLTISVDAPDAEVRVASGRIEAKTVTPNAGPRTLTASFAFTASPVLPYVQDETGVDPDIWLSPNEGPIQVTERVRALAAELAPEASPAFERVMVFRDYLIDTMAFGMIHSECLSASAAMEWVLDNRWLDCRAGSALLAALCRVSGIPARLIGGYLLWNAPTEHYWIEAWLPDRGWTPFDLLAWDLSAGGDDQAWRNVYAGTIDYRMKTQVFPNLFTGPPGVTMTTPWHRLARAIPGGAETRFISIPHGDLFYADRICVIRG